MPELDRYLNDAYMAGLPFVRIVHGKGTGVLRQVVREYLRGHPLVKSFDFAGSREGGEGKPPLTSEEILVLLQKMVKQREESFMIYANAGRNDLATVEKEGIDILNEFLPKGLTDAEIEDAIKAAIAKTGAAGAKDMGKVIASLKADYPGRIDFGKASGKVKAALG